MKKKDLKTGHLVETKTDKFIVFKDTDLGYGDDNDAAIYVDDVDAWDMLKYALRSDDDIIRVHKSCHPIAFVRNRNYNFDQNDWEMIYEKKEEKPIVTIDGVEYSESTLRSIIKKAHS